MESKFADFRVAMAHRLRAARGDLTQAQLAELTGYTQQMISRYESGRIPRETPRPPASLRGTPVVYRTLEREEGAVDLKTDYLGLSLPHPFVVGASPLSDDLDMARRLEDAGAVVTIVDVGTQAPATAPSTVPRDTVAACHPKGASFVLNHTDRGAAVEAMSEALDLYLQAEYQHGHVQGVIGIGGSGGTALITRAMRSLPVGLPKLMVSTVASGNVAPYVDCGDICMMPSSI